jgi:hypothetical protein
MADPVNLKLHCHIAPWANAAIQVLSWACLLTSIVSMHAALWLSEKGCLFIARHGTRVSIT